MFSCWVGQAVGDGTPPPDCAPTLDGHTPEHTLEPRPATGSRADHGKHAVRSR
jgi:hypothetical protein